MINMEKYLPVNLKKDPYFLFASHVKFPEKTADYYQFITQA